MSDDPTQRIVVADTDITMSSIKTQFIMEENAISYVTLTADDEDGKSYLATLKIGDLVTVQGMKDGPHGYNDEPTDWTGTPVIFSGTVQELMPVMNKSGQVCSVTAYGQGYQLKKMRVAQEYGYIYPIVEWGFVYVYKPKNIGLIGATDWSVVGSDPYINAYSFFHFIYVPLSGHINTTGTGTYGTTNPPTTNTGTIGAFSYLINGEYNGGEFVPVGNAALEGTGLISGAVLHIVAGFYDTSGTYPTSVIITPYWTIDGGVTWKPFHSVTTDNYFTITTRMGNQAESLLIIGYPDPLTPDLFPYWSTYPNLTGYNPITQYGLQQPPAGQDLIVDMTVDLPYWNSNLLIKFVVTGVNGTVAGSVSIAESYIEYYFLTTQGKTVRQLLAGEQGTVGIIGNFVNNTIPVQKYVGKSTAFPTGFQSITLPSGYLPLTTDYVVLDSYNATMTDGRGEVNADFENTLIAYLKFPYEDCLTAIQDIIKYESALQFLTSGSAGYHWIVDPNGNLLVAPVNNHHVYGIDTDHYVDSIWVLQPQGTPLVVKQDMITQDFKTEPPIYNFIMVAGNYQYPLNDDIGRGINIGYWQNYTYSDGVITPDTNSVTSKPPQGDSNAASSLGNPYLEFSGVNLLTVTADNIWAYPLQDDEGNVIDLTQLMGFDSVPAFNFWFRWGGNTSSYELRLFIEDHNNLGHPFVGCYFTHTISNNASQDNWGFVTINLPNVKYLKDFNGWKIASVTLAGEIQFLGKPASIDFGDFSKVKYFAIKFTGSYSATGPLYVDLSGFYINGIAIRGAYDSASINLYGCRMKTIRDNFAQTDTLTFLDTTPLSLEAYYDLQRYRLVRTTGTITIPFDPKWMAGQQVWIQAEDVIPIGSQWSSGISNPTTSTVGNLGEYYINTATWEVFLCTAIVGSSYTWTDQNMVRYKINQWFRITKVTDTFGSDGALTSLTLTTDLMSSLTADTNDVFTVLERAIDPDFQSKTLGSLKSESVFDLGLPIIAKDYAGS
jgi:hypothetical protein